MSIFDDVGDFVGNVVKTTGKAAGSGVGLVSNATGIISKGIARVPVIGAPIQKTMNLAVNSPLKLAQDISNGKRIDKAIYEHGKSQIRNTQDVAPYAQTVFSMVPGGQGISGVIGAGLALTKGRPLDEAFVAGIRDSIPGGPAAKAAFEIGNAVIKGRPLNQVAISALPIDENAKRALIAGLATAADISQGKRVDKALIERGMRQLPPVAQKALQAGIAVAHGQKLQAEIAANAGNPAVVMNLAQQGNVRVARSPMFRALNHALNNNVGYKTALGLTMHGKVTPSAIAGIRSNFKSRDKKAFDMGLAAHVGVTTKKLPKHLSDREKAGYVVTHGMSGHKPGNKAAIMKTLANDNSLRIGAANALKERANPGIIARVVAWFEKVF